ncbi:MAG: GTP-binding protein [Promethearchaeota archaeon]|nr:MAG: GTP-binding protein [Candidatus Lokiarchaeota archaeon]
MPKSKVLKTIITGEGGVGKTTLLHRYIEGRFQANTRLTIGVEFFLKELAIDEESILLQIWDFGGQERFRFLLSNYVKGAKGALLLFDLTRPLTLNTLEEWVNICRSDDPELPILLVGSKADLEEMITINEGFIKSLKNEFEFFDYIRISSKTGENVDKVFEKIACEIINHVKKTGT